MHSWLLWAVLAAVARAAVLPPQPLNATLHRVSRLPDAPANATRGQFAGLVPVTDQGDQLFYWLQPCAAGEPADTPVVLWLPGGPGASSLVAAFTGAGGVRMAAGPALAAAAAPWTAFATVVFVDAPVGTGFSPNGSPTSLVVDEAAAGRHLASLWGTLRAAHALDGRPLFLAGEGVGARHAVAAAAGALAGQVAGVVLTGGWVHPEAQYDRSGFARGLGLLSAEQAAELQERSVACRQKLAAGTLYSRACASLLPDAVAAAAGVLPDDARRFESSSSGTYPAEAALLNAYLGRDDVRAAFNVAAGGRKWAPVRGSVGSRLRGQEGRSALAEVRALLVAGVRVAVVHGQFDLGAHPLGAEAWLRELAWPAMRWGRTAWHDESGAVAGFLRRSDDGLLELATVLHAGHFVAMDAGGAAQELVGDFVLGRGSSDAVAEDVDAAAVECAAQRRAAAELGASTPQVVAVCDRVCLDEDDQAWATALLVALFVVMCCCVGVSRRRLVSSSSYASSSSSKEYEFAAVPSRDPDLEFDDVDLGEQEAPRTNFA